MMQVSPLFILKEDLFGLKTRVFAKTDNYHVNWADMVLALEYCKE